MRYRKHNEESIDIYLKEAMDEKKFPLLTAEQERELAKRIHKGDKEARDKLVCSFLRYVVSKAKRYMNLGVSLEDLIESGNKGLIRAAEKYDAKKGRFYVYASEWIKQGILMEISRNSRTIKFGNTGTALLLRIKCAKEHLTHKNQHEPNVRELSDYLEEPAELVSRVISCEHGPISLDSLTPEDGGEDYSLCLQDKDEDVEGNAIKKISREDLLRFLSSVLKPREVDIIKRIFKMNGEGKEILEDIGRYYHISKQRVVQIKERALRKLRGNSKVMHQLSYFR